MRNFSIQFAYSWSPWLFFLLIPAIAFTLIPYFRLAKKYRRTRNRIISLVLHSLIMVLTICVLTGMTFNYTVPNPENEIILLVDVSDTQVESEEQRDAFVHSLLSESRYDGFKVGVVTFGFTQNYAVPLTYDVDEAYSDYLNAELPDTSATDIAAALRYARTLFSNPGSSKIVLITDGKETDESATSVIRSVTAQGTKVDVVYVSSQYEGDNVQVLDIEFPDYHLNLNEECSIVVTVQCKVAQAVEVALFDNGAPSGEDAVQVVDLGAGTHTIAFRTSFKTQGLHEMRAEVKSAEDSLTENNEYYSYIYLDIYNNILVIERYEGDSDQIEALLGQEEGAYNVDVLNIFTGENIPTSVDDLRRYDQIIMNNIANKDLPDGFDEILYSYVYDYGGGLLTVGGNDPDGNVHAYNRSDMNHSLYQQILPVQAINYTPPVGVIIIIDISGSMLSQTDNGTALDWAKQGAIACLDALTERDYVGIMTLDTVYSTILPLTSCTQERVIREAILNIGSGGATNFAAAIDRAGQALVAEQRVDKRHIIMVTDGAPGENASDYLPYVDRYYAQNGITISAVGINMSPGSSGANVMQEIVDHGHGRLHFGSGQALLAEMREDLNVPEIKEVNEEPFNPTVANKLSPLLNGVEYGTIQIPDENGEVTTILANALPVQLGGFYGVQAKASSDTILIGEYEVPIYSQWKFGAGMVGSFMCDLNGTWSSEFLTDPSGQRFIFNAINNLMPLTNIRSNEITINLREENYINQLSIYAGLESGQYVRAEITDSAGNIVASLNELTPSENIAALNCYVTLNLSKANNYTRCTFIVKQGGVYHISVKKYDKDGNVLATLETFKSFAYSEEYNPDLEGEEFDPKVGLAALAKQVEGEFIETSEGLYKVFENFVTALERSFDPRWLFIILAIVMFLMDIAVRKFKFKWIHEIVRERKAKQAEKNEMR